MRSIVSQWVPFLLLAGYLLLGIVCCTPSGLLSFGGA